jgi:hypothetical protein
MNTYDIRGLTFEEFIAFLFGHDINPSERWYWDAEVAFDANEVAQHYIQLFRNPWWLTQRYSLEEIEQGFWAAQSCTLDCAVTHIIWDSAVPLKTREECISAMYDLYERFFARESLATSSHMWWDSLAFDDWHLGKRDRAKVVEDAIIQDVMFETLSKILALNSRDCQMAALHGLSHLHHPGTPALIQDYLQRGELLDEEQRSYAEAAARFELM